jgi:hypothetical protein
MIFFNDMLVQIRKENRGFIGQHPIGEEYMSKSIFLIHYKIEKPFARRLAIAVSPAGAPIWLRRFALIFEILQTMPAFFAGSSA